MAHVLHYLVEGSTDIPHHQSGDLNLPKEIAEALGLIPLEGVRRVVCLCNEKIALDEIHGGTGEPHVVTCADCMKHETWRKDILARPNPKVAGEIEKRRREKGCC